VPESFSLILALCVLAGALAAAVARARLLPEALVASAGAAVLVGVGASSVADARHAVSGLGSTVCFLAALLVLADGCRRDGLFDAIGALLAVRARQRAAAAGFGHTGRGRAAATHPPITPPRWPRVTLAILALTLAGFAFSSLLGIAPVWIAAAGAIAISAPALERRAATPVGIEATLGPSSAATR
jgi:Na+/H+ antiporter NhaD/arsenite permease-like protein